MSVLSDLVGSLTKIVQSISTINPVNAVSVLGNVAVAPHAGAAPSVLSKSAVKLQVPEVCFKEALPCEVYSLGFYLSAALKEKIWKREFVDVLSLLQTDVGQSPLFF